MAARSIVSAPTATAAAATTTITSMLGASRRALPAAARPCRRLFSSSSSASSSSSSPTPPSSSSTSSELTWPQYFRLRKSRSTFGTVALIPSVPLALGTSGTFFLTSELNPMQPLFGLDPTIVAVGATLASGFGGYLVGPLIGNGLWSLLHQKQRKALEAKDAHFYEHVRKNRVDPSRANMQNRLPDYYGEKIYSLSDYRKWLRECSDYRRKAAHGLKQDELATAAEAGTDTSPKL